MALERSRQIRNGILDYFEPSTSLRGSVRLLKPLADSLNIPKLNFQVIRRTIATRAQSLGSVKDIQSHLRHSRADTTANEYMQELPRALQQMVGTVFALLNSGKGSQMVN
jgi:integrase